MDYPLNNLPRRPHELGDEWVFGPNGEKFWGRFGAAGLLAWHRDAGVMLQLRATWSHHGDTWGLPGGALKSYESAVDGALREANEEAGVPPESLTVLFTTVFDREFWSYTTVVAEAADAFIPVIGDAESQALAWVALDDVAGLALHPGFAASWPELRKRLDGI
jgi:8-oxo-dGTP pyrophosphatase MutT (NUDIX family)